MHVACIVFFFFSARQKNFLISNVPHYLWWIWGFYVYNVKYNFPFIYCRIACYRFLICDFNSFFLFCWNDVLAYIIQFVYGLEYKNWTVFRNYYNPVFMCIRFNTFTTDSYVCMSKKKLNSGYIAGPLEPYYTIPLLNIVQYVFLMCNLAVIFVNSTFTPEPSETWFL